MIEKNTICELRVVCRHDDEQKYPFTIDTQSRYIFPTFAEAEAAIPRLIEENATKVWIRVYRYEIYTFEFRKEIQNDYDARDALDVTIYLPDGTRWISKGERGVIEVAKIYEHLTRNVSGGHNVNICIVENDYRDDNTCEHIILRSDYNHGWNYLTDMMPCSLPVSDAYAEALRSKCERYYALERDELSPILGVPYPVETKFDEDMSDYLFIPAAFSGFKRVMSYWIPCQNCGKELPSDWSWYVCDKCGFRVCPSCLGSHKGPYSLGGFKCSQCAFGYMKEK